MKHILEISQFPTHFKNEDFMEAFDSYRQDGFDIKWVDSSHVLAVFSSSKSAWRCLKSNTSGLKVRPLSQATRASKVKARRYSDFLQPSGPRPQTSALTAKRLVMNALGLRVNQSKSQYKAELAKLKQEKMKIPSSEEGTNGGASS
ncbi:hypothetical protein GDO86_000250 [Hymenochirus boettgeri]|uniref:Uncharacterized protein n=1 Tax=Hymenochirus boettgeri TaxID=247094 RepID=A0A8T2K7R2_9PIPI|nr:hypothetical protein GDO86_000250 [Hymenochirus boettgeri]